MLQMTELRGKQVLNIDALAGLDSVWEIVLVGPSHVAEHASKCLIDLYCSVSGSVRYYPVITPIHLPLPLQCALSLMNSAS